MGAFAGTGIGPGVAFGPVGVIHDRLERLRGIDDKVGNAELGTVPLARAEVGMERRARTDKGDEAGRIGVNFGRGDIGIPQT
jgi:hypothetical protein